MSVVQAAKLDQAALAAQASLASLMSGSSVRQNRATANRPQRKVAERHALLSLSFPAALYSDRLHSPRLQALIEPGSDPRAKR